MNLLSRRMVLMSAIGKTLLPKEYQQVEYLESTGTQWIDTGFMPNGDTTVSMDYQLTEISPTTFLYGVRGDGSNSYKLMYNIAIDSARKYAVSHNTLLGSRFSQLPTPDTNRHVMHRNKGTVYIDNAIAHTFNVAANFECAYNLEIFALNNNNIEGALPVKMKLYSFKIYDNGTLIRDFKPCYRKADKVAGLYDTVSGTLFENQGKGNFLIGGEI